MAVLIAEQADEGLRGAHAGAPERDGALQRLTTIGRLITAPLPPDVREEEYTVAVLFRGSLVLNFATGGRADMTFSARCHRARLISRNGASRALWFGMAMSIDTACAILRGEREHCAVAWSNHLSRGSDREAH